MKMLFSNLEVVGALLVLMMLQVSFVLVVIVVYKSKVFGVYCITQHLGY